MPGFSSSAWLCVLQSSNKAMFCDSQVVEAASIALVLCRKSFIRTSCLSFKFPEPSQRVNGSNVPGGHAPRPPYTSILCIIRGRIAATPQYYTAFTCAPCWLPIDVPPAEPLHAPANTNALPSKLKTFQTASSTVYRYFIPRIFSS